MNAFRPVLAVMNPRQIPNCVDALERLAIRKVWLSNYTEWQLQEVIAQVIDGPEDFTDLVLTADDVIVSQQALDAVLTYGEQYPVVTGYCRLDSTHPEVNITRRPLMGSVSSVGAYDFYRYEAVRDWPREVVPTGFVGFALTCMSREMWRLFPFGVFGDEHGSYCSDFHLSIRLRDASVPMLAARDGYVHHVKETWNQLDEAPVKRLLIGERVAEVRWSE